MWNVSPANNLTSRDELQREAAVTQQATVQQARKLAQAPLEWVEKHPVLTGLLALVPAGWIAYRLFAPHSRSGADEAAAGRQREAESEDGRRSNLRALRDNAIHAVVTALAAKLLQPGPESPAAGAEVGEPTSEPAEV